MTATERSEMEAAAERMGFASISEYVRHLHTESLQTERDEEGGDDTGRQQLFQAPDLFDQIGTGHLYHGDSRGLLQHHLPANSVDLIVTSPPFGLVRKKSYGNEDAHRYVEWFRTFAPLMRDALKDSGSLVIDIGGAWKKGYPTRSLYHYELLIMLCEEFGFHLCQEHYWWNPSKLPTPAEWVNIRRVRVKDAVNCVWWLSKTPFPKANNKRVLFPYSGAMKTLLKNGYRAKNRPSGHKISTKFGRDNGGAVPPNLLAIANTESNGQYQAYCRENGITEHPARFPSQLPEYFVRFLTDPGDIVVDPFAGSCVTGAVCERLGRSWYCCDTNAEYLQGAKGRFTQAALNVESSTAESYTIHTPCAGPDGEHIPLIENGGRARPNAKTGS